MTLTDVVRRFQRASRELRNRYFHPPEWDVDDGDVLEQFRIAERALFACLMTLKCGEGIEEHGTPQPKIAIIPLRGATKIPAMVNRATGVPHGYWDYPVEILTTQSQCRFARFFDFDQTAYADNQYVMGVVVASTHLPDLVERYVLIEAKYIEV